MTGVGNNWCPFINSPRGHDERAQGHRQPNRRAIRQVTRKTGTVETVVPRVRTPGRMCWPIEGGEPQKFAEATTLNRQALLRGDSAALQDALRGLAESR